MTWHETTFRDLFRVKHGFAFQGEFFDSTGDFILLTPGNFYERGGFKDQVDKRKYYTGEIPEGFILKRDDLLVVMTEQAPGLLGSSAWIPESDKYLHNQRLGLITDRDEELIDKRFLYYLFNTVGVRHQISASATGTKVRHTSPDRIGRVKVALPPLATQRRIAGILSAYDDLIENNRRRVQLLEQAARLIYDEWFVRLRFPGYEQARIVDGVPEGWERTNLGQVAKINQAQLRGSYQGNIEYVDISSVSPGVIDSVQALDFREAPGRARRVVYHGDILWSCVRPNRRSHAIVWNPPENMIASTGFAVISPSQLPTSYLYYAITTDAFVGYLSNRAHGGAYPAVLASDFEDAELLKPSHVVTDAFDMCVRPIIALAASLRLQNEKLRRARDLLLPRLMSGEVEV